MKPATHENDLRNDERNKQIIRLVKSGVSYTETAAKLGLTRNAVAGVCKRAGVKMKREYVRRNNARRLNGNSYRKGVFSERASRAIELRQQGYPYKEIAAALGYASDKSACGVVLASERRRAVSNA